MTNMILGLLTYIDINKSKLPNETTISARIIINLREWRSTIVPANGPINACGKKPAIPASANMSGEPVVSVNHQMILN